MIIYDMSKILWFVFINITLNAVCRQYGSGVLHRDIRTTQGLVRGYLMQNNFYAYLGIPYAQTSVHNRFKAPKPPRRWDSIFEATHHIKCPQGEGSGDENCLVLNVFTSVEGTSLPVLVYVHGGDFQSGWGPTIPIKLLIQKNIIIVTFNYRLGALGFLCLKIPEVPGNAGLKDQVAALYWIHRNILNFGGNPLDVTVYGVESGAVSIQLLLLSRLAEGLFQKVILETGSILSPKSITYNPVMLAFNAAKRLGYDGDANGQQLAMFFSKLTVKQLLNTTENFLPCIEAESYYSHSLVDSDPIESLEKGNFETLPMIIIYADKPFDESSILDTLAENFESLLPSNLEFPESEIKMKIAVLVKGFYFDESEDYKIRFANYMNDVLIHYPTVKIATMFAARSTQPVFVMRSIYGAFTDACLKKGECDNTVGRLLYTDMDEDVLIQEMIVTLLGNFINIGDPTPLITTSTPVIWQPISIPSEGRLAMNFIPQLVFDGRMKLDNAATQQILFWNYIYDKYYRVNTSCHNETIKDYEEMKK
ncbi:hypothetical protein K1T71_010556 [Dendrolimus kikuchii]|uniref:Uncharacterized protein n=1 Tax=Dendrolimus kikuchii TaxID=765133 RepID=A0ACC1CPK9_9NEOP|nr:hypothetical protein K1T71_010556 [Dendrolimus kikuchii]